MGSKNRVTMTEGKKRDVDRGLRSFDEMKIRLRTS